MIGNYYLISLIFMMILWAIFGVVGVKLVNRKKYQTVFLLFLIMFLISQFHNVLFRTTNSITKDDYYNIIETRTTDSHHLQYRVLLPHDETLWIIPKKEDVKESKINLELIQEKNIFGMTIRQYPLGSSIYNGNN